MSDPLSDPFTAPLMAKVLTGLGGFVGGATFMAFYRPKNVWDAAIRSSVSTSTAIIGAIPALLWLNITPNMDMLLAAASVIGFCSWSILSLAARTLLKIQDEKTTIKLPNYLEQKSEK